MGAGDDVRYVGHRVRDLMSNFSAIAMASSTLMTRSCTALSSIVRTSYVEASRAAVDQHDAKRTTAAVTAESPIAAAGIPFDARAAGAIIAREPD